MLLLQGVSVSQKMKVFEIIACFGIHKYTILWIRRSVFRWVKMQPAFFGKSIFITCDCQRFFGLSDLRMTLHIYRHTERIFGRVESSKASELVSRRFSTERLRQSLKVKSRKSTARKSKTA